MRNNRWILSAARIRGWALALFLLTGFNAFAGDIIVSGVTTPSAANGTYTQQTGQLDGKDWWKHESAEYYVYYAQWQTGGSYYWNIDVDTDEENTNGALFYSDEASSIDSPWEVSSWATENGVGSVGVANASTSPEISVAGNGNPISSGSTSPVVSNFTEFQFAEISSGSSTRTFDISNAGGSDLTISSITFSGAHAGEFSVTANSASTVASAATTSFTITFNPSGEGYRTATVSIANNDSDENPFTFAIRGEGFLEEDLVLDGITNPSAANGTYQFQGYQYGYGYWKHSSADYYIYNDEYQNQQYWNIDVNLIDDDGAADVTSDDDGLFYNKSTAGTPKGLTGWDDYVSTMTGEPVITALVTSPEIDLLGNTVSIVLGDTTPSFKDHTHFGSLNTASGTRARTFTIENTGNAALTLSGVSISGDAAGDFSITTSPANSIAAGSSSSITIEFDASATGVREALLTIENDDSNESSYSFAIQGDGFVPEDIELGGVITPADANGVYIHQGIQNEFQYWKYDTGTDEYYIYNDEFEGVWYWNIDVNLTDDDGVIGDYSDDDFLFYTQSIDVSPVALSGWSTNNASGHFSDGTPVFGNREIEVIGDGSQIVDGDATPSEFDQTDFGTTNVGGGPIVRTFDITNSGTFDLHLTSTAPYVEILGAAASDFVISSAPDAVIAGGSTTTVTVAFSPSASGIRSATLSIANDDHDENPFTFAIQGSGFGVPAITTTAVTVYDAESATMGGNVTADGGAPVSERGILYSSSDATPELGETGVTQDTNGTGTGSFSESIAGLIPGTLYSIQAYAMNTYGTNYGGVVSFTTEKYAQTITFDPIAAKVYGDSSFDTGATASSGLTIIYEVSDTNVATVAGSAVTIEGAGSCDIIATQLGNVLYAPAENVTNTLVVSEKSLSVTNAVAQNKVYAATQDALISGAELSGVVSGDVVTISNSTFGVFVQSTVGTNIQVTTSMVLTGADASNYTLMQPVLTADILTRELSVTNAVADHKIYDTTADATVTGGSLSGVQGSDDVVLANAATGTFAQVTIGTNITVSTVMSLTGADAPNYFLTQPSLLADITAKMLVVTNAVAADKVYDGTTDAVVSGASLDGVLESDDVALGMATNGVFAQASAGTNISVSTTMSLVGTDIGNYALSGQPVLAADISKANQEITFAAIGAQDVTNSVVLNATTTSGLAIQYSIVSGLVSIDGTTMTFPEPSYVQIAAVQDGNENWNPDAVTNSFDVVGVITNVAPAQGTIFGGTEVTIDGVWLGDGSDITNVTLCDVAAVIVTQGVDFVVVETGATNSPVEILGDVVVESGYGTVTLADAYIYNLVPVAPVAISAVDITSDCFTARWETTEDTTHYYLDVSETTNFTDYVGVYSNWNAGASTAGLVTGLVDGVTYWYRVRAANAFGSGLDSNLIEAPVSTNTPYIKLEMTSGVVSAGSSDTVDLTELFHGNGMTYTVVSNSNPALVTAGVLGSELILEYVSGMTGRAEITVRVTDANGFWVETTITVDVVLEPDVAFGEIVFNPQNGLFEQVVTVTNGSALTANTVTLTVTALTTGIEVYNATGIDRLGLPEIQWNGTLAAGASMPFTLQYFSPMGTVPSATVEVSLSLEDVKTAISGRAFNLTGEPQSLNGSSAFLLEFDAVPGRAYYIQYQDVLGDDWKTVYPAIVAPVNKVQWIDSGPPATESMPSSRFYQVIEAAE